MTCRRYIAGDYTVMWPYKDRPDTRKQASRWTVSLWGVCSRLQMINFREIVVNTVSESTELT